MKGKKIMKYSVSLAKDNGVDISGGEFQTYSDAVKRAKDAFHSGRCLIAQVWEWFDEEDCDVVFVCSE